MKARNWLDLTRKLVDKLDMDFTSKGIAAYLGEQALSYFGEGVLITTTYPNPFPITMSGIAFNGSVGNGIGYDPNGQITRIDNASTTSKVFTPTAADVTNPRWDLLVIRYIQTGDTLVPKPSDPIMSVDLNLHDDFVLAVVPGTPSATPAYPAKGSLDIVLAGLRVPANATLGTQIAVDLSIREMAVQDTVKLPIIVDEIPVGAVDGVNQIYTLSQTPLDGQSLLLMVDNAPLELTDFNLVGNVATITAGAPAPGQRVRAWYIAGSPASINPLKMRQEVPTGAVDGVNDTFTLAGAPVNNASTFVFVDKAAMEQGDWQLIQGAVSKIQFLAGNIPAPGQRVYVAYFLNTALSAPLTGTITNGNNEGTGVPVFDGVVGPIMNFKTLKPGTNVTITPGPGPGEVQISASNGGNAGLVRNGDTVTPVVVNPAVGVVPLAAQRQIQYIKSSGGAAPVTAVPQIAPGITDGEEMILVGTSDVDYIELADGNGVSRNGTIFLKNGLSDYLVWDQVAALWRSIPRG